MKFSISAFCRSSSILLAVALTSFFAAYGFWQIDFFAASLSRWMSAEIEMLLIYGALIAAIAVLSVWLGHSLSLFYAAAVLWTIYLFGIVPVLSVVYLTFVAIIIGQKLLLTTDSQDVEQSGFGLRAALGYSILLGLFQLTAFFPINTGWFVLAITFLIFCYLRAVVRGVFVELTGLISKPLKFNTSVLVTLIPFVILLVLLVYASYPESHSDALVTHLMMPHQVWVHAKWNFDVSNFFFAVMPKGAVWLFSAHYLLGGEMAVRLFNFIVTAYAAWLVYHAVEQESDRSVGALLTAIFLSAPLTAWVVFVLFEDAILAYFVLAAAIILAKNWSGTLGKTDCLVAILVSAAVATKMQGLFAAVPIGILLIYRMVWITRGTKSGILACALPILCIGTVPYMTAAYLTGNPVFPMFNEIFQSAHYPPVNFSDNRWSGKSSWKILYDITLNTKLFMEGSDGAFGVGHLVLLPGAIIAVLWQRSFFTSTIATILLLFSLLLVLFTQYARYYYPTFALSAVVFVALFNQSGPLWRKFYLIPTALLIIAFNLALTRSLNAYYRFILPVPWFEQRYVQPSPVAERHLNEIVNSKVGPSARVLYLPRPYGAGLDGLPLYGNFLNPRLQAALQSVRSQNDAADLIDKWRVTNVITLDTPDSEYPEFTQALPSLGRVEEKFGDTLLWSLGSQLR